MSAELPIVVVTPVKNEAWILDRFLAVTSQFADLIIIADQQSTDASREICRRWKKVVLLDNPDKSYNEASRQLLLLAKARELLPGPKVIFALDADEILAANALQTKGWQKIFKAQPGTVILLEKPDLYLSTENCIRWRDNPFPIGFVDDGSEHRPKVLHSTRVPLSEDTPRLVLDDVKVLHYALANPLLQKAKGRYYSVVENVECGNKGIISSLRRRHAGRRTFLDEFKPKMENPEQCWFQGWEKKGIDMRTVHSLNADVYAWHDFEILRRFADFGVKRFYWDNIWYVNWEERRQYALKEGFSGMPSEPVCQPTQLHQYLRDICVWAYSLLRQIRKLFRVFI
jgi:glycosyltransferase involved in cell wall biosynthesis